MKAKAKQGRKTEVVRVFSDTADIMRQVKAQFRVPLIHLYDRAVSEWIDNGPQFDVPYGSTAEDREEIKGGTKR